MKSFLPSFLFPQNINSEQEVFLQSAFSEIENYIKNGQLDMADMALREYLNKIQSASLYFNSALALIRPHINSSNTKISDTAQTKLESVKTELSALNKWQKKSKLLLIQLESAFKAQGKKQKTLSPLLESKKSVDTRFITSTSNPKKPFWRVIIQVFKFSQKSSEDIKAFDDAIDWIRTYISANEYDKAILASRELLLK